MCPARWYNICSSGREIRVTDLQWIYQSSYGEEIRKQIAGPNLPRSTLEQHIIQTSKLVFLFLRMRSSLEVRAPDCQCTSCNGPGFDPSMLRHSNLRGGRWSSVEYSTKKKSPQTIFKKDYPCVLEGSRLFYEPDGELLDLDLLRALPHNLHHPLVLLVAPVFSFGSQMANNLDNLQLLQKPTFPPPSRNICLLYRYLSDFSYRTTGSYNRLWASRIRIR